MKIKPKELIKDYFLKPSFIKLVGELKGKSVLDLGCGGGYFTRLFWGKGAGTIVGVDISEKTIRSAFGLYNNYENLNYVIGDARKLPIKEESFDIVSAVSLLHCCPEKEDLENMCINICNSLKNGGKFLGLNADPEFCSDVNEGELREITYSNKWGKSPKLRFYNWKKETYEEAFKNAGFNEVNWFYPKVSREGIKKFGESLKEYEDKLGIIGIECVK